MLKLPIVCINGVFEMIGIFELHRSVRKVCRMWRDIKIYSSNLVIPKKICVDEKGFEKMMDGICLSRVRKLCLDGCGSLEGVENIVEKCSGLIELSMCEWSGTDVGWVRNLVGLQKLDLHFSDKWWMIRENVKFGDMKLRHFSLHNCMNKLGWLRDMKELEKLELVSCVVESQHVEELIGLKYLNLKGSVVQNMRIGGFVNLEYLNLEGGLANNYNICDIGDLVGIKCLILSGCEIGDAQGFEKMVNLERLDMVNAVVTRKGIGVIGRMKWLKHLDISDLAWGYDDDDDDDTFQVEMLEGLRGGRLEYLDLALIMSEMGDEKVGEIIGDFVELKFLGLWGANISDFMWLLKLEKLEHLELAHCAFATTEEVIKLLALRELKVLDLRGCMNVDVARVRECACENGYGHGYGYMEVIG